MSHLFPATDIGTRASSVAAAAILGALFPQGETKMAPTTMTVTMANEMRHGVPSTQLSDPCPMEDKGEGDEEEGRSCCCLRRW